MKKLFTALLAALLSLCLCSAALADTGASPVLTYDKTVDVIYGTSLLRLSGADGYAVASLDLAPLTEARYSNLSGTRGYIEGADLLVEGDNCFGLLDMQGQIVVPFQYGVLDVMSHEWCIGIVLSPATADAYDYSNYSKDAFWNVASVDVYHLPEGKVATLSRDQYVDADVVNHHLLIQDRATGVITAYDGSFNAVGSNLKNLYDDSVSPADLETFRENGQYGLKAPDGTVVLEPCYQYISDVLGDYVYVSNGDSYGIITLDGTVVVPVQYDTVRTASYMPADETGSTRSYNAHGYFTVIKDNKVGFINANGVETFAPKYAKDAATLNGCSFTLTDLTGDVILVAGDGVETTLTGYENIYCLDYSGGMYYRVRKADGNYGVIDWHGNEILPLNYSSVSLTADGQHLLADVDYKYTELYSLSYPVLAAAAEAPATPDESTAESAPASASPAATVLNTAITLLTADPAANSAAVASLLDSAKALIGDTDASAIAVLSSAQVLLTADPAGNAESIITLLNTVLALQ